MVRAGSRGRPVSELTPIATGAEEVDWVVASWRIRAATHADVPAAAKGVAELLGELGGTPPAEEELQEAVRTLVDHPAAGTVLVAESDDGAGIVGVLGVSAQQAIRIPGRYWLIQELWVHPSWRGRTVGGDLLVGLFERARREGIGRIEVGLPSERFPHLAATEAFYVNNGFTPIGLRMRRLL
jgi:GNAT superfamily N-acetyltransferase